MDFQNPVKKLLRITHPDFRLSKAGLELISKICDSVNKKLVENTQLEIGRSSSSAIEDINAAVPRAVRKTLKGTMGKLALARAEEQRDQFLIGRLAYDAEEELARYKPVPKQRKPKTSAMASQKQTKLETSFRSGITKIADMVQPEATLTTGAKSFTSIMLHRLAALMTRKALDLAPDKERLEPQDIRDILSYFVNPLFLDHAMGEGMRAVNLHATGLTKFVPKPPAPPKPVASKKKKDTGLKRSRTPSKRVATPKKKGKVAHHTPVKKPRAPPIFTTGAKKMASQMMDATLDKKGARFLDGILSNLANRLAETAAGISDVSGKDTIRHNEMSAAVNNMFPSGLSSHSEAVATRYVAHYATGLLKYRRPTLKPRKPRTVKAPAKATAKGAKGAKRKAAPVKKGATIKKARVSKQPSKPAKEARPDFTDGNITLLQQTDPNFSLAKDAADLLNQHLRNICKKLAAESAACAREKGAQDVTPVDIKEAVETCLTGELAQHAISEGVRAVNNYWTHQKSSASVPSSVGLQSQKNINALSPPSAYAPPGPTVQVSPKTRKSAVQEPSETRGPAVQTSSESRRSPVPASSATREPSSESRTPAVRAPSVTRRPSSLQASSETRGPAIQPAFESRRSSVPVPPSSVPSSESRRSSAVPSTSQTFTPSDTTTFETRKQSVIPSPEARMSTGRRSSDYSKPFVRALSSDRHRSLGIAEFENPRPSVGASPEQRPSVQESTERRRSSPAEQRSSVQDSSEHRRSSEPAPPDAF